MDTVYLYNDDEARRTLSVPKMGRMSIVPHSGSRKMRMNIYESEATSVGDLVIETRRRRKMLSRRSKK